MSRNKKKKGGKKDDGNEKGNKENVKITTVLVAGCPPPRPER